MTNQKRNLILDLAEGNRDCLNIIYQLDQYKRADEMLFWLFKNKIKGIKLIEVFKSVNSSSLSLATGILQRIENDKKLSIKSKDMKNA